VTREQRERKSEIEKYMKRIIADDPKLCKYKNAALVHTNVAAILLGENVHNSSFRTQINKIPRVKSGKRMMVYIGDLAVLIVESESRGC